MKSDMSSIVFYHGAKELKEKYIDVCFIGPINSPTLPYTYIAELVYYLQQNYNSPKDLNAILEHYYHKNIETQNFFNIVLGDKGKQEIEQIINEMVDKYTKFLGYKNTSIHYYLFFHWETELVYKLYNYVIPCNLFRCEICNNTQLAFIPRNFQKLEQLENDLKNFVFYLNNYLTLSKNDDII